jgi:glycerol-3-phosphate cytidylyltransferase|tara:strand:- start:681 stop:1103 length:423 start_codon:yes stop_codon:yes gene_type:complete
MSKKKVGITASTFDLLHAGHCAMLREAKTACDYLICALQNDPSVDRPEKNKPIQNIVERQMQLASIRYVDEILVYNTEEELLDILAMYDIDVKIMGVEYRDKDFTGRDLCKQRDIEFYFNKRDHRFSTSDLRQRVCERDN